MLQPQDITEYFINNYINEGDVVIDATAGNGYDTIKLCKKVGTPGKVYAFDIQKQAIESTKQKLESENIENALLILDNHTNIDKYVADKVKAVIFNLGYLPKGDHRIHTKGETTIIAIKKSLDLLDDGGFISITVYYGKNSGTDEKNMVMEYIKNLDCKLYTATVHDFYNRPNNPPLTIIITKN